MEKSHKSLVKYIIIVLLIQVYRCTLCSHLVVLFAYTSSMWKYIVAIKVASQSLGRGKQKRKPGLQSGPGLLLVSGLGFPLGQNCFA